MGVNYVPDLSGEPPPVPVSLSVEGPWRRRGRARAELIVGTPGLSLGYNNHAGQSVFSAGASILLWKQDFFTLYLATLGACHVRFSDLFSFPPKESRERRLAYRGGYHAHAFGRIGL